MPDEITLGWGMFGGLIIADVNSFWLGLVLAFMFGIVWAFARGFVRSVRSMT